MKNNVILLFGLCLTVQNTNANSESYGYIIQRQAKQIQELQNRILKLENHVNLINFNSNKDKTTSDKSNLTTLDLAKINEENLKNNLENNDSSANHTLNIAQKQDKSDYDIALATLKEGDFDLAEQKFLKFIENYPASNLQTNAIFWYSETFYHRGIFDKAAINYLKGYKKYPKGVKAPDTLLKLAYSLAGLKKNKEACNILKKLESEFPERSIESIKRSDDAKSEFNCKQLDQNNKQNL